MAQLVGSLPVRITCICYISYHETGIHSMVPGFHLMVTGFTLWLLGFTIWVLNFILCLMYNRSITIYFGTYYEA